MKTLTPLVLACFFALSFSAFAEEAQSFPPEGWEPGPSPLASDLAEEGGRFRMAMSQYPKSFNYLLDLNVFSGTVFGTLFDTVLGSNPITLEKEPGLAKSWTISADKKVFTIVIDERAKWSDGKPITAHDVAYTWEAIMKPENLTGSWKAYFDKFETVKALDDQTVQFTAKTVHWNNLNVIGNMNVLPKHWWEKQKFDNVHFEFPVTSGEYRIKELKEGQWVRLERRDDYWNADDPRSEFLSNFDEIEYRFHADRDNAFDHFRKQQFDIFAVHKSQRWIEETNSEHFQNNWIIKQEIYNKDPIGFQGFAMNLRKEKFQDLRVRKALYHLLDRKRMNATLMHNAYFLHKSVFEDLYDEENPCTNDEYEFDIDKARALLKDAGWEINPKTQKLEKNGEAFTIEFLTRSADSNKFLFIYREALAKVGIELTITQKDWAGWSRDLDAFNYEMTWVAYAAGVFKNPEPMWHSKYKDMERSLNATGFGNAEVDKLIDSLPPEFDVNKRNETIRKIDKLITDQVPMLLLWNLNYTRIAYWNTFGMPDHVFGKYGSEISAAAYWWLDPDSEDDLAAARESGKKLPGRPFQVRFNQVFGEAAATEPSR